MSAEHDATEFVDDDFQAATTAATEPAAAPWTASPAPSPAEVDARVTEAQQKLAELKRQQETLERERASLEDLRRRQIEFQTGREEMQQNLARGLGLLEEAEVNARRDAELAAKTLADFKDALNKIQSIDDGRWTKENLNVELTRALTIVENARMEWNAARVRLPVLTGEDAPAANSRPAANAVESLAALGFWRRCQIGLALTWPFVLLALIAIAIALRGHK